MRDHEFGPISVSGDDASILSSLDCILGHVFASRSYMTMLTVMPRLRGCHRGDHDLVSATVEDVVGDGAVFRSKDVTGAFGVSKVH